MKINFISQVIQWFNFWIVLLIVLVVAVGEFTKVDVVKVLSKKSHSSTEDIKKNPKKVHAFSQVADEFPLGRIYQRENIFGVAPEAEPESSSTITSFSLPKMKELTLPEPRPVPKVIKKATIIEPLNITVNGVITCDDFYKNLCMISDSSGKEQMYKVGDLIETSAIVSINSNGVSLIRPNGQIETFCLGLSSDFAISNGAWSKVVDKNTVEIDYSKLEQKISSIGELIQELGILPSYNGEVLEGFVVTSKAQVVKDFGLAQNDMIVSVQKSSISSAQSRIELYNKISAMDYGESFVVQVKRGEELVEISYNLKKIDNSVENESAFDKKDVADKKSDLRDSGMINSQGTNKSYTSNQEEPKKEFLQNISPEESFNQYYRNIEEIKKRLAERINSSRLIISGAQ